MKTYTLWAQERDGELARVPFKRAIEPRGNAMEGALRTSAKATLCDLILTCGRAHVATFRNGQITALDGKEYKA